MEMVMKFNSSSDDVEVVSSNKNGKIVGKLIGIKDVVRELVKVCHVDYEDLIIDNFDENILYFSRAGYSEIYIIKLPERKIKCTFKNKGYSIIHPNSIFMLDINPTTKTYRSMKAYCYKEYKGKNTELYRYPFPNMLGSNAICTGTISNDATDPMKAIMNVIEGNYTHESTSTGKIKKTVNFFQAIKNEFKYDILEKTGMSLNELLKNKETKL